MTLSQIFEITFIIIVALIVILGILLILWATECVGYSKIKFSAFKKFYAVNPDRWDLRDGYITCQTKLEISWLGRSRTESTTDCFSFGFIDYYRYKLFLHSFEKRKKTNKDAQATMRMIAVVKEDIAETEKKAEQKFKEAINMMI